jgi:hypothetical protein
MNHGVRLAEERLFARSLEFGNGHDAHYRVNRKIHIWKIEPKMFAWKGKAKNKRRLVWQNRAPLINNIFRRVPIAMAVVCLSI